jgi:hypothetical protein
MEIVNPFIIRNIVSRDVGSSGVQEMPLASMAFYCGNGDIVSFITFHTLPNNASRAHARNGCIPFLL